MTKFNQGWWNCFNSFANNTIQANDSVCYEVLRGAGVTKEEAEEVLHNGELYGTACDIVNEFIKQEA